MGVAADALARLAPRRAREVLVVAVAEGRRGREEAEQCDELHVKGVRVFRIFAVTPHHTKTTTKTPELITCNCLLYPKTAFNL